VGLSILMVIFIITMIRYAKHKDISYIIVDSSIEVEGVVAPIQVQVDIRNIKEEDRTKVFRVVSIAFNRPLTFNKPKLEVKRSWWQRIINI